MMYLRFVRGFDRTIILPENHLAACDLNHKVAVTVTLCFLHFLPVARLLRFLKKRSATLVSQLADGESKGS